MQSKSEIDEPWREILLERKEESFEIKGDGSRRKRK